MNATPIDLDAYRERIGYFGERTASLATLQRLIEMPTQEIAFENLSGAACCS